MATYTNTVRVDDGDLFTALGLSSLSASDVVKITDRTGDHYTTNLDLTGAAMSLCEIGGGYFGSIGGDGSSLLVDATTLRVFSGGDKTRIAGKAAATVTTGVVRPANHGEVFLSAISFTRLAVGGGRVTLRDGADATSLNVTGSGLTVIETGGSSSAITTLSARPAENERPRIMLDRDVGTLNVGGGSLVEIRKSSVSPTTVNLEGGWLKARAWSAGTVNCYGGVLDLSELAADGSVTTFNLYGPVRVIQPAAGLDGWNPADAGTFNDYWGLGATIAAHPGR